ncbi:MAG: hypothetical protein JWR52_1794 [Marmoricola sp.]|nr:hypothetical protein [Marmoricola sp.]
MRPNEHPIRSSIPFGVISYIGLLVFVNPHLDGSSAYGAGQLLVPAAIATTLVALVVRGSKRRFNWWAYGLAVPIVSAAMAIAVLAMNHDGHEPAVSATPDSAGKCDELLPQADGEALVGTSLDEAQIVSLEGLSVCGWAQADGKGRLSAGSIQATEWAKSLPTILAAIKQQHVPLFKSDRLRVIESLLAKGLPSTNTEACSMFRDLIVLEYPGLQPGSDTVVGYVPDKQHAVAISAQSCRAGRFRALSWYRDSGVPAAAVLTHKFLDAVNSLH